MAPTTTKLHPIYVKCAAGEYLGAADVAALVRTALARRWPATRFYVRSNSYAGGSAVRVAWHGVTGYAPLASCYCAAGPDVHPSDVDRCRRCNYLGRSTPIYAPGAPTLAEVQELVGPYEGKGFDGMIDLAYYKSAWLLPDGTAVYGRSTGTEGSRGTHEGYSEARPAPAAVLARWGSYVFAEPHLPYEVTHRAELEAARAARRARKAARIPARPFAR